MIGNWKIIYYYSPSGQNPVFDFIQQLNSLAKAKVINALNLLEEYGVTQGVLNLKKINGTPLWEIRILGKDNIRIFYVTVSQRTILLLHGFIKKKQQTDKKEIKTALERLKMYKPLD